MKIARQIGKGAIQFYIISKQHYMHISSTKNVFNIIYKRKKQGR